MGLVVGGDKLDCKFDAASPANSLLETKLLIKSVIYDARRGSHFMSLDLKDHFLTSPTIDAYFMHIP